MRNKKNWFIIFLTIFITLFCIFTYENFIRIRLICNNPVILLFPSWHGKLNYVFNSIRSVKITQDDMEDIVGIVNDAINTYNKSRMEETETYNNNPTYKIDTNQFLVDKFEMYVVQSIAVRNKNGEKEIWLNCIHKNVLNDFDNDWKKAIMLILDGGPYFFNIKINLTKKIYYDLQVNGY
jgi:hypothetical protein